MTTDESTSQIEGELMTRATIKRHLKALREECIESTDANPIEKRVAWAMETAIRRMTERVVGWPSLIEECRGTARLICEDLKELR